MTDETVAERELRLAQIDIDNPRPEFWRADVANYRAAQAAVAEQTAPRQAGHTPGPWTWDDPDGIASGLSGPSGSKVIEDLGYDGLWIHPSSPDARLIAAAPDMLEALRPFAAFLDVLESMGGNTPRTGPYCGVTSKTGDAVITVEDFASARAAIRKATEG